MPGHFMGARPHVGASKGAALAAATVLAGAGLFGVAAVGPEISGAPLAPASHSVALTAFPTFAESLQNLLNTMGVGDLNQVLAALGDVPGTTTPLSVTSNVSDLLAAFNPDGTTLAGVGNLFGILITEPLYSANAAIPSLLGTGGVWLVNGVPIGNLDLGDLVNVVLGAGAGTHSLTDLANALNLGSMLTQYGSMITALGLPNLNVLNCTLSCGNILSVNTNPDLTLNSSLVDWLSGILGKPTTDVTQYVGLINPTATVVPNSAWTLGEYLHILPISTGSTTMMDAATLAQLFNLTPTQPWDQYLDGLPFGGTLLDPSGETWGTQTLSTFLASFLPEGSTLAITGDTPITDILEAFGLLNW
ncbi:hypothetical protein [[Mycobacterium] nativiensis]|uniref:PE-PGRS family protein n=1 Tax=[Mycobacterium] nativiensis TaxID=2855503 RepID=A0ABU5XZ03_9MYCO|nr:hypothetical protein [Mycolicibacter sp. MYC340]MEB3033224.1 hypothetical protein [Mycolicibacter sp. MYC340]